MNKLTHFLRRTHNLLGLVVGAQVLIWVLSGLIFSLKPISEVRGDHLRREVAVATLPAELDGLVPPGDLLAGSGEQVSALRLRLWLDTPVWEGRLGRQRRADRSHAGRSGPARSGPRRRPGHVARGV